MTGVAVGKLLIAVGSEKKGRGVAVSQRGGGGGGRGLLAGAAYSWACRVKKWRWQ